MSHWALIRAPGPWGDYSDILTHGMVRGRVDGRLQLARLVPVVPSVTLPGRDGPVVTERVRRIILESDFTGFELRPVDPVHVVRLDWSGWDRSAPEPLVYPQDGEPEGYLLDHPHEPASAAELPLLWELVAIRYGRSVSKRLSRRPRRYEHKLELEETPPPDLFRTTTGNRVYASDRFRRALQPLCSDAIDFGAATLGRITDDDLRREPTFVRRGDAIPEGYEIHGTSTDVFTGKPIDLIRRRSE